MNVRELTARVEVLEALAVEMAAILVRRRAIPPSAIEELGGRLIGIATTGDIDEDLAAWMEEDLMLAAFVDRDADWGEEAIRRIDRRAKRRRVKFGPLDASMTDDRIMSTIHP